MVAATASRRGQAERGSWRTKRSPQRPDVGRERQIEVVGRVVGLLDLSRSDSAAAAASAISLRTATRASDRRRSSRISLARITASTIVRASETSVMTMSTDSMPFNPSSSSTSTAVDCFTAT